jgi:hypothetical protein
MIYTQLIEFVDKMDAYIDKKGFFCYDYITFGCEYLFSPIILLTGCG